MFFKQHTDGRYEAVFFPTELPSIVRAMKVCEQAKIEMAQENVKVIEGAESLVEENK